MFLEGDLVPAGTTLVTPAIESQVERLVELRSWCLTRTCSGFMNSVVSSVVAIVIFSVQFSLYSFFELFSRVS